MLEPVQGPVFSCQQSRHPAGELVAVVLVEGRERRRPVLGPEDEILTGESPPVAILGGDAKDFPTVNMLAGTWGIVFDLVLGVGLLPTFAASLGKTPFIDCRDPCGFHWRLLRLPMACPFLGGDREHRSGLRSNR